MNKKEILADLEQIKSSLEELETQRDDIQILCIKSELELSIGNILSDYKRVLKENEEFKREIEKQKDINTIINTNGIDKCYEKALEKTMTKFLNNNIANDFIPKKKVKDKIKELSEIKGDFATYIATSERIKALSELLESEA
nr:MAG TPA: hypothetical protein [Caudoviricetes sp.]